MTRSSTTARWSWPLAATVLAATAGWGCYVSLPLSTYQSQSILALDGPAALRAAMARATSESIVSKPIVARAASLLVGADIVTPQPGFAERVGVVTGIGPATSRQARMADAIAAMVHAAPGLVAGTVEITVQAPAADQAARVADAMSDAFLAQQDEAIAQVRARREARVAARIESARADMQAARQRFAALGGSAVDPAEAKAAAAARTAAAETRLASIRAILASGSPPISDRKDLPPVLAAPQAAYLDLKAQLAKESETLGERHTTIIALKEAVRRAAATLSGEWNRLTKIAAADLASARAQEATLHTSGLPADAGQRAALEEARRAVQVAEEGFARAQKQDETGDDARFRAVGRAPVPDGTSGWSSLARAALSALAALITLLLVWNAPRLVRRRGSKPLRSATVAPVAGVASPRSADAEGTHECDNAVARPHLAPAARARASTIGLGAIARRPPLADTAPARRIAASPASSAQARAAHGLGLVGKIPAHDAPSDITPMTEDAKPETLIETMRAILSGIETIQPRDAMIPTVMIAANEPGAGTTAAALALGQVAAEANLRVLLIETARSSPDLAASVDAQADPILIDLYGRLRIGVQAETGDGLLTLAPVFRDAERLASGLAMNATTALIEEAAHAFDLILIDADVAADAMAAGWTADAFLRVGASRSARDDLRFCGTLDVTPNALLATIIASASEPRPVRDRLVSDTPPTPVRNMAEPAPRQAEPRPARPARAVPLVAASGPRRRLAG